MSGSGGCGNNIKFIAANVPFDYATETGYLEFDVPSDFEDCKINDIEVRVGATGQDLSNLTLLHITHNGTFYDLIRTPVVGTNLGSGCGLVFRPGAADFATANPPYSGTFRPDDPGFEQLTNSTVSPVGNWYVHPHGDLLVFDCFQITFDLVTSP